MRGTELAMWLLSHHTRNSWKRLVAGCWSISRETDKYTGSNLQGSLCARPTSWSEADDFIPVVLPPIHIFLDSIRRDHAEWYQMHTGRVRILRQHSVQLRVILAS